MMFLLTEEEREKIENRAYERGVKEGSNSARNRWLAALRTALDPAGADYVTIKDASLADSFEAGFWDVIKRLVEIREIMRR